MREHIKVDSGEMVSPAKAEAKWQDLHEIGLDSLYMQSYSIEPLVERGNQDTNGQDGENENLQDDGEDGDDEED